MKRFMDERFLLHTDTAWELYAHAEELPIIDYHCHLIPQDIAQNRRFRNITDLALRGDHYKWRLMRACGVDERFITGDASDEEKFQKWCGTIEDCIGSPVYHWTHLEMRRYFGYEGEVSAQNYKEVWNHCNAIIDKDDFDVWSILKRFRVEQIGTTDDPADTLEHHLKVRQLRQEGKSLPLVTPTFRPSGALDIDAAGFGAYLERLGAAAGLSIGDWDGLLAALGQRLDFFQESGCLASDHALDPVVFDTSADAAVVLAKALRGEALSPADTNSYKTGLMLWLGGEYHRRGWAMQLHMGAQRNNNSARFRALGPDTGFDGMSDEPYSRPLAQLLDALELEGKLPKTILYGLNPASDAMLSVMIGHYQGGGIPGKMQWGSAWWFNDTKTGMQDHLVALANNGVLARFIGMLTDSRSFMSFPRHEYFRRILAQTLAGWVDAGEFPRDMPKLQKIMADICYNNSKAYFGL